ncbi:MAG: PepSY domain-containing protein [Bdellovibrionales bacterium]|nr:PepSY domain-containing protein [Bdellovibrionales bacterium]
MMKSKLVYLSTLGLFLCLGQIEVFAKSRTTIEGSISVKGKSKSEYSSLAKISLQDAIAIATKSAPGKVIEAALDREDGFLVYEIEVIATPGKKELLIDAGNGKILLTKEKGKSTDDDEDEE